MAKKRREPDYTLNIFPYRDEETMHEIIVFLVQTTKIFVSFRYEILLDDHIKGRTITIRILGLHVPEILLPQTGPARGRRDFTDLQGTYTVRVVKQDQSINEFQAEFHGTTVQLKRKPSDAFILASTDIVDLG
jgi:hypothetical protein